MRIQQCFGALILALWTGILPAHGQEPIPVPAVPVIPGGPSAAMDATSAVPEAASTPSVSAPVPALPPATRSAPSKPEDLEDIFEKKRFTLNVKNGELRDVIRMIAERGGLELRADASLTGTVTVSLKSVTLAEALDRLAEQNSLEYLIDGDRLTVKRVILGAAQSSRISRTPGSAGSAALTASLSGSSAANTTTSGVREIPVKYSLASEMFSHVKPLAGEGDRLIVDALANSLIFQGSEVSFIKIAEIVRALDRLPQQVLIEAQIVETSRSFLQAFGLSWGQTRTPSLTQGDAKLGFVVNAAGPSSPNGSLRYVIGDWGGVPLDVRLSAAESTGDAKVISRPKVVTLNNTPANINSGISFNVKTLSAVGTGGGGGGVATGGVATLNAGLTLMVTPTLMGTDLVKLSVAINNSQPDEAQIVDGIPGIVNNSATTSVIVTEGRTAVIAGLVKNTGGRAVASVPLLANIPILGALFRNQNVSDRNNELVIFITPHVVTPQGDLKPQRPFGEPKINAPTIEGSGT